ncbi:MAG: YHS domain-containing protein [Bacteroidetes bacterium]|nr:YHS domain-containing protein [Bacteroidota bacterium]
MVAFSSCNETANAKSDQPEVITDVAAYREKITKQHDDESKAVKVDNKKDPVCGMPAKEVADTTMYKGKVIGFCSKECKADFLKNPGKYKVKYK